MTFWMILGSAFWLGVLTSISPCPLATNIAAISFLGRSVGDTRKVLLSGLLYTLGRMVVYAVLGVLILWVFQAAAGDAGAATSGLSRFLQKAMGVVLGPVLIVAGLVLLEMVDFGGSLTVGGERLQKRAAGGGALWAFALGVLFALSFCPVSASLFFGGLIGLSARQASPVWPPVMFGVGTAAPVLAFAFGLAFAGRWVGRAFGVLTRVERWLRALTGAAFLAAGLFMTLTHVWGVRWPI